MNNEDWDPTGYYTRKLESRRHGPAVVGVCVMMMILLVIASLIFPQSANAHPLPAGDKEKVATIRIKTSHCEIYKITVDGNDYLVNSCGGIVLVPKATGTTRTQ